MQNVFRLGSVGVCHIINKFLYRRLELICCFKSNGGLLIVFLILFFVSIIILCIGNMVHRLQFIFLVIRFYIREKISIIWQIYELIQCYVFVYLLELWVSRTNRFSFYMIARCYGRSYTGFSINTCCYDGNSWVYLLLRSSHIFYYLQILFILYYQQVCNCVMGSLVAVTVYGI